MSRDDQRAPLERGTAPPATPAHTAAAHAAPEIRMAVFADSVAFAEHVLRHSRESGLEGSLHFALSRSPAVDEVRDSARARWSRRLIEPLWGRAWLLWGDVPEGDSERGCEGRAQPLGFRATGAADPRAMSNGRPGARRRVVGHVELRGGRVRAELHRAVLAMGIQRAFTRQGYGPRLIEVAVRWARDEAKLSWIDLGVFSHNEPARKLYSRMGFIELGMQRDAFRIDAGLSVDDIRMTLKL